MQAQTSNRRDRQPSAARRKPRQVVPHRQYGYNKRMNSGFLRAACASPRVSVADCAANAQAIIDAVWEAERSGVSLVVFPELAVSGYTCGDLFLQQTLQSGVLGAIERIAEKTAQAQALFFVGAPLVYNGALYNCAAAVQRGRVLAVVPKTFIPEYGEFYEKRWFAAAPAVREVMCDMRIALGGRLGEVPFGTDILFRDPQCAQAAVAAEICEDLWTPVPPSSRHALCGACIVANLSASNEIIGKAEYRRLLVRSQSARLAAAYLYADAGYGESTTDMVFAGHNIIAENGTILAESELFSGGEAGGVLTCAELDLDRLAQERLRTTSFAQSAERLAGETGSCRPRTIDVSLQQISALELRSVDPYPFVPSDRRERSSRCNEVLMLQAQGLVKRIAHTNAPAAVVGLSGGLDSTLALLAAVQAFRLLGRDASGIIAVTMPCFGTTERTLKNARQLAQAVGASFREIPIAAAVRQHFSDIGHNEAVRDVTYENAQARERTQVLMDIANQAGGIVIGTGDLSELALGWATYNGDHMSMYGINASVPKTLVRHITAAAATDAEAAGNARLAAVLRDILDTPVSPELLPAENGTISQKTEELVGPYALHDFFLYYMLRWGFGPKKIYALARRAFGAEYDAHTVLHWLSVFCRRFFAQQFKRSCLPDGAKVGTVSLSPRGDWRMPSDASQALWQAEIAGLKNALQDAPV